MRLRSLIVGLPLALAMWAGLIFAGQYAFAGLDVPPAPAPAPDLSAYQAKSEAAAAQSAMQSAVSAMQNAQAAQATKQSSIPTSGPGPGLCRLTVVPSNLVSSGGVTGTAGTCSRIVQCGTSADFVVTQFNIGGGC